VKAAVACQHQGSNIRFRVIQQRIVFTWPQLAAPAFAFPLSDKNGPSCGTHCISAHEAIGLLEASLLGHTAAAK
jgi:hypothetical protein